jgi:GDP-mannose 6-dehydrogenase
MLGLSFKMNTDDLRESPNVELAERLLGKGFEVRIYDPIVNPERLMGSNLRYIESRLPHLRRLLVGTPAEALAGAEAAIVATSDEAALDQLRSAPPEWILDLHGRLGTEIERLPAYEGVGWAA